MISHLHGKNSLNYSVFHTPLQKAWSLEGSSRIFSSAEGKEPSDQNSLSSENIIHMICYQQSYPEIIEEVQQKGNAVGTPGRKKKQWRE